MLRNTPDAYGWLARSFHWILAVLIIVMLIVGHVMQAVGPDLKGPLHAAHESTGLLVLALVLCRFIWRLKNPVPALPADLPTWQKWASHGAVIAFYFLMIAIPITGLSMVSLGGGRPPFFGLFSLPALAHDKAVSHFFWEVHGILGWALIALIGLHVAAGLYHHFVRHDTVLRRMLRG